MYYSLGISITLAFLLIINMAAAAVASLLWRVISGSVSTLAGDTQAKVIFALRIVPVAAALVFVLAFAVPAYLLHEPAESGEVVTAKLALLSGLCMIGVAIAAFRVFQTWLSTRRLMRNWLCNSTEFEIDGVDLPVNRISHQFPVLAVVGILRPRIFIAEIVYSSLTEAELRAAIAHEYGHLRGRDNLKRTILRVCRDLVVLPIGTALDLAWAQTAETAADEYAARKGGLNALDLASALVKISRIVPENSAPALPIGAYIISDRGGDIASRVSRLLHLSEGDKLGASRRGIFAIPSYVWSVCIGVLLALHLADQRLLLATHEAIEHFVWLFQ